MIEMIKADHRGSEEEDKTEWSTSNESMTSCQAQAEIYSDSQYFRSTFGASLAVRVFLLRI
jgi:hypothetical protein